MMREVEWNSIMVIIRIIGLFVFHSCLRRRKKGESDDEEVEVK